jgi:hypothetical protein
MVKKKKSTTKKTAHIAMTPDTKDNFDSINRKEEAKKDKKIEQEDMLIILMDNYKKEEINNEPKNIQKKV